LLAGFSHAAGQEVMSKDRNRHTGLLLRALSPCFQPHPAASSEPIRPVHRVQFGIYSFKEALDFVPLV
jgi:hypothetical protein